MLSSSQNGWFISYFQVQGGIPNPYFKYGKCEQAGPRGGDPCCPKGPPRRRPLGWKLGRLHPEILDTWNWAAPLGLHGAHALSRNVSAGRRKGKGAFSIHELHFCCKNWAWPSKLAPDPCIILAPTFSSANMPLGILGSLAENFPCSKSE